jgi:hypothetical protein
LNLKNVCRFKATLRKVFYTSPEARAIEDRAVLPRPVRGAERRGRPVNRVPEGTRFTGRVTYGHAGFAVIPAFLRNAGVRSDDS